MIMINKNYLNYFKHFNQCYNYQVSNGVWISFSDKTLLYTGLVNFIDSDISRYTRKEREVIEKLINRDILFII